MKNIETICNSVSAEIESIQSQQNPTTKSINQKFYKCEKCMDAIWIAEGNNFKRCDCFEIRESEELLKKSGIKDDTFTFSNFEVWNESSKELKNICLRYYKNFDEIKGQRENSIAIFGQSGSGKTHLSIALSTNIIKNKHVPVMYLSYRDAITKLKQNIINEDAYKKSIDRFQKTKLLVIDDLLKGKTTESDKNIMFEIINYRYLNHLPIIISCEYGMNDLLNFDEAIGSRIYEMCKDYLVEVSRNIKTNYRLRQ